MVSGPHQRGPGSIPNLCRVIGVGLGGMRLDQMRGDHLGHLLFFGPRTLQIRRSRHVTQLAIASRQGAVRDTPYEVLDEDVLAAFRRPRVRLDGENDPC